MEEEEQQRMKWKREGRKQKEREVLGTFPAETCLTSDLFIHGEVQTIGSRGVDVVLQRNRSVFCVDHMTGLGEREREREREKGNMKSQSR